MRKILLLLAILTIAVYSRADIIGYQCPYIDGLEISPEEFLELKQKAPPKTGKENILVYSPSALYRLVFSRGHEFLEYFIQQEKGEGYELAIDLSRELNRCGYFSGIGDFHEFFWLTDNEFAFKAGNWNDETYVKAAIKPKPAPVFSKGLILPLKDRKDFNGFLISKNGFNLYDDLNGKLVGVLRSRNARDAKTSKYATDFFLLNDIVVHDTELFTALAWSWDAVLYTDSKDGFVRIFNHYGNLWLNKAELEKEGFKALPWMDFMTQEKEVIAYALEKPGMNLREKPDASANKLDSVLGDFFEITFTGETDGQWAKVKVTKNKNVRCFDDYSEEKIEYKKEGWMKVIDDNGEPNLSFYLDTSYYGCSRPYYP